MKLKVVELKSLLEEHELDQKGTKAVLVARLIELKEGEDNAESGEGEGNGAIAEDEEMAEKPKAEQESPPVNGIEQRTTRKRAAEADPVSAPPHAAKEIKTEPAIEKVVEKP